MNNPQRKRVAVPAMVALAVAVIVFLVPALLPRELREPWEWVVVVVQALITVGLVIYLVRFVRKQRDDYWRERGRDPKHP